jgi:TPP-dependent pyruvate/acetoin dehydrogenase alpha subunit
MAAGRVAHAATAALSPEQVLDMYRQALRIRRFEERAVLGVERAEIAGSVHASIGQEGVAVGACGALRSDDFLTGTHRSHGHLIAKGAPLGPLMAELMGKRDGLCKGKGGSMHAAAVGVGCLGACGIVASSLPVAAGVALSAKHRGTDQVCLAPFGDGGANTGAVHETMNLAAVWKLPVVFLCENNGYALTTPVSVASSVDDFASRASAYGIPGTSVDGQDAVEVYGVVAEAVARARRGSGPSLIEARTYRYREHAELGRMELGYRSAAEIDAWRARDPVAILRSLAEATSSRLDLDRIGSEVDAEIADAVAFALDSPWPEPNEVFDDLFVTPVALAR